jgi:hypothetical protein
MNPYVEVFTSIEDIISNYEAPKDALDGAVIYLAWYGYGSYDGQSLVIFEKDGKLYEVNGSHCSCYGLEGQWEPEETSWEALAKRKVDDNYTSGAAEADKLLKELVSKYLVKKEAKQWVN